MIRIFLLFMVLFFIPDAINSSWQLATNFMFGDYSYSFLLLGFIVGSFPFFISLVLFVKPDVLGIENKAATESDVIDVVARVDLVYFCIILLALFHLSNVFYKATSLINVLYEVSISGADYSAIKRGLMVEIISGLVVGVLGVKYARSLSGFIVKKAPGANN